MPDAAVAFNSDVGVQLSVSVGIGAGDDKTHHQTKFVSICKLLYVKSNV